jgi:hypothetical protein
VIEVKRSGAQ